MRLQIDTFKLKFPINFLIGSPIRGNHVAQISKFIVHGLHDLLLMQQASVLLAQHLESVDHLLVLLLELLSRLAYGGIVSVALFSVDLAVAYAVVLHQIQLVLLVLFGLFVAGRWFAEIWNLKRRRCWR